MPLELRLTARFLQPVSHGRGEDGLAEWPPSPLRLYQALVASSVGRWTEHQDDARAALRWLERQPPPQIFAPSFRPSSQGVRYYVPDNVGDRVAGAWSAGREANFADWRTEKDVMPVILSDFPERDEPDHPVHYVYAVDDGAEAHFATLKRMAHSLTHLGWGIDMVVGDAVLTSGVASQLEGEQWHPGRPGRVRLRTAMPGTLAALEAKHSAFLGRLEGGLFRPVPPLAVFGTATYARSEDEAPRPTAMFALRSPSGQRLAKDPARCARDVAAWLRHAVSEVCHGWPFGPIDTFVHGHIDEATRAQKVDRLSFIPLPTVRGTSLGSSVVGPINRVLIAAPIGFERELDWIRKHLAGTDLVWDGEAVAYLDAVEPDDYVTRRYLGASEEWTTTTPVILPGNDDRNPRKADKLLLKAFAQAGVDVAQIEEFEMRDVGFLRGVDLASNYRAPDKLAGPQKHVRVRFRRKHHGPLVVGSGRHRGLGVFVTQRD